jgi:hypothetical protein
MVDCSTINNRLKIDGVKVSVYFFRMEQLTEVKGFIPSVVGGLGNQLFITCAAYAAAKHHNCPLYILQNPVSNNKHNARKYNYNDTLFKYFGTHLDVSLEAIPYICMMGYNLFNPRDPFAAWNPSQVNPGTVLECYYQYYPVIQPFEHEIREKVLAGLAPFRDRVQEKLGDLSDCAFLHVRRGDTHAALDYYMLTPIEYFKRAVDILMTKGPVRKIYIVSDEMTWVREQEFFQQELFELYETPDELETLALMSLCTKGAIGGGQTFSWWGAFLGAYGLRNPVVYPDPTTWIRQTVYDLIPKEWIVLKEW